MSEKTIRILLVEDNAGDTRLLREMLNEPGSLKIELTHLGCMSEAAHSLLARWSRLFRGVAVEFPKWLFTPGNVMPYGVAQR